MLHTRNLQFAYKSIAFKFPDIHCAPGEVLLITGQSGKGKTTLLHLLGGLLRPEAGSITIGSTEIQKLSNKHLDRFRGNHIGIIFQQAHYVASLSVLDNLLLATHTLDKKRKLQQAKRLLQQTGMEALMHQKPDSLSMGQQQRLSIIRALVNKPLLLLSDEPTSSLDDDNCYNVAALLKEQAYNNQSALIIVTHDRRLKEIFPKKIEL